MFGGAVVPERAVNAAEQPLDIGTFRNLTRDTLGDRQRGRSVGGDKRGGFAKGRVKLAHDDAVLITSLHHVKRGGKPASVNRQGCKRPVRVVSGRKIVTVT